MRYKVVGKYGRYAPYLQATNCYIIETDNGKNIVLDLGSGALCGLQKYIDISQIDAVIVTHLHFDHACDLGVLAYSVGFLGLDNIKVYMPKTPEIFNECYSSSKFDITIIDETLQFEIDNITFNFAVSPHPVETYSVIMTTNNKKIVYTSDCQDIETIKKNTAGADIVIGDACVLDKDYKNTSPHISVKALSENVPKNCKLYLSHLTFGEEDDILKEAREYRSNADIVDNFEL